MRPATVGELPDGTDVIQGCTVVHIDAADCMFKPPDGSTKKAGVLFGDERICEMCRRKWCR